MVETSDGASSSVSDARHIRLDFVLAACICLAAVCYWLEDTRNDVRISGPQPALAATDPSNANDFNENGFRLYSASNYVGADAQFRKAIRANPKAAVGYCNLGAALIAERRFDEAIATLRIAISLDPSLTLAQNNLNWALQEKSKLAK